MFVNSLFKKEFPAKASEEHVTTSNNVFEYEGVKIIDAVGNENAFYKDFEYVRVVHLSSSGRVNAEKNKWIKEHPNLEDNAKFVLNWQYEKCYPAEFEDLTKNKGWEKYENLTAPELLQNIPPYKVRAAEANSPRTTLPRNSGTRPREPQEVPVVRWEKVSPKFEKLQDLEETIIQCLNEINDVKENRQIGDTELKLVCQYSKLENAAWDNSSVADFMKEEMPKLTEHLKNNIYEEPETEISNEKYADALEAVFAWSGSFSFSGKQRQKCGKALKLHYTHYCKNSHPNT